MIPILLDTYSLCRSLQMSEKAEESDNELFEILSSYGDLNLNLE
jgi:hypothetical protein